METSEIVISIVIPVVLAVVVIVGRCAYFVPEGMLMATVQFGRFKRVYGSGLAFLGAFEQPLRLDKSTFEYVDNVHGGIYLPMQFRFDPAPLEVASRNSTTTTVDPVLVLRVKDMQKMYFAFPTDEPLAMLVDEMANMCNEVCRKMEVISRDHFRAIADQTKAAMTGFCAKLGIEIVSFELQGMQLSKERLAIEQEAENVARTLQLEASQRARRQDEAMAALVDQQAREMRAVETKHAKNLAELNFQLQSAEKQRDIARVEAETQVQLLALLREKNLVEPYHQKLQLEAQIQLAKGLVGGAHSTFVVDQSKILPFPSLQTPVS